MVGTPREFREQFEPNTPGDPQQRWENEEVVVTHDYNQGPYTSWVLILESVSRERDTFRRVGMGVILSNSWSERRRTKANIEII